MTHSRSWLLISVGATAFCCCPVGCDRVPEQAAPQRANRSDAGFKALGQEFVDALSQGEFAAAYALCAARLKTRQSQQRFADGLAQKWQRHTSGQQLQDASVAVFLPGQDEFNDADELPSDVPRESLRARIALMFTMQSQEGDTTGVEVDLFVVEEQGQHRIVHYEFYEP